DESTGEFDDGVPMDFFQIRRSDGSTVKRSKSLKDADLRAPYSKSHHAKYWNFTLPSGKRGRAIGYEFHPEIVGTNPPPLSVVFPSDRHELDESLSTLALILLSCGGLLLAATAWIVPWLLRRELAPLDQLAAQASQITADSLSTRFSTESVQG